MNCSFLEHLAWSLLVLSFCFVLLLGDFFLCLLLPHSVHRPFAKLDIAAAGVANITEFFFTGN